MAMDNVSGKFVPLVIFSLLLDSILSLTKLGNTW